MPAGNWSNFITKWDRYDKVATLLQRRAVHRTNAHQTVGQKNVLPFPIPFICLTLLWLP